VLGTYSIDDNGDTTLTDLALETVQNGKLKFDKVVKGAGTVSPRRMAGRSARPGG